MSIKPPPHPGSGANTQNYISPVYHSDRLNDKEVSSISLFSTWFNRVQNDFKRGSAEEIVKDKFAVNEDSYSILKKNYPTNMMI